jgi:4-hydroxybenzoate polyprenyltransferase
LAGGDALALARSVGVVLLVLVVLRIADDLRSIEHDCIASPERGLPAGRIRARPLAAGAALLFVAAAALAAPRLTAALLLAGCYYAAYYRLAERVPLILRPPLVNAVFLAIPSAVGILSRAAGASGLGLLGLLFWLSAVGHDFAHEVHARREARPGVVTVSQALGPRLTSAIGAACYAGAFAAGLLAAHRARALGSWPPLFVTGLAALYAYTGVLLVGLIARPSRSRARRLYVRGVVCFAVPSLLLGFDRVLGW